LAILIAFLPLASTYDRAAGIGLQPIRNPSLQRPRGRLSRMFRPRLKLFPVPQSKIWNRQEHRNRVYPGGLPIDAFDGIRKGVLSDRSQFFKDLTMPFYGYNRPGAKVSEGVRESFWLQGTMAGMPASYFCIKAFSETDQTEDLKKVRQADPDPAWRRQSDRADRCLGHAVFEAGEGRDVEGLQRRAARHVHHAEGRGERRPSCLHQGLIAERRAFIGAALLARRSRMPQIATSSHTYQSMIGCSLDRGRVALASASLPSTSMVASKASPVTSTTDWARHTGLDLDLPIHCCIKLGETMQIADNESSELVQYVNAVGIVERSCDFIVIDTPGSDGYLMRLAHSIADTLVTPINDSFLDFDVLGTIDPVTYSVTGESHYAEMVRDARRKRRQLDGASTDWIVVRNRLSMLDSRNKQLVADGLNELSLRLGFRSIDGFTEREVYREFLPRGLTALDDLDEATLGTRPSMDHVTAREEVTSLLRQLKLPLDERGRRRAANRAEWFSQVDKPLEVHDIFGAA
jgi:chromosome partitioning protein